MNIIGLTEHLTISNQAMMDLIAQGMAVRVTSVTGMNLDSSRSHAILAITIRQITRTEILRNNKPTNKFTQQESQIGKLTFIDLAGNERASDVTDMNKITRIDGAEINKSLLDLKECIRALGMDKNHIPFRYNIFYLYYIFTINIQYTVYNIYYINILFSFSCSCSYTLYTD